MYVTMGGSPRCKFVMKILLSRACASGPSVGSDARIIRVPRVGKLECSKTISSSVCDVLGCATVAGAC